MCTLCVDGMNQRVCDVADVPPGASRRGEVGEGLILAVFNVEGKFYVLDDTCSHGEASLAEGEIVGCEIICPLHSGQFDLATGKATRRPAKRPQRIFPVDVVDGQILVNVDDEAKGSNADGLAHLQT